MHLLPIEPANALGHADHAAKRAAALDSSPAISCHSVFGASTSMSPLFESSHQRNRQL